MLEEYMLGIGFDEKQIKQIQKIYPARTYTPSTLLYNIKNLHHFLRRNGVNNSEFVSMVITIPNILFISTENIKSKILEFKELGFSRLYAFSIIKNYPYLLDFSYLMVKQRMDEFEDLGFRTNQVTSILTMNPKLFREDFSMIRKKFAFFIEYGYSIEDVVHILTEVPQLFDSSLEDILKKIADYKDMGFQENDIIRITSILPNVFFHDVNLLHEQFQYLLDFGYQELDIIQVVQRIPILLKENYLENISNHIDCFIQLGFSQKSIILMTCNNPYLFLYSVENITNKFMEIKKMGYQEKDVIMILEDSPILFGYDIRNIKQKYEFYQELQLEHYLISHGNYYTYNFDIIQARYHFLNKSHDMDNDYQDLFLSDVDFEKKYHIKKNLLLKGDIYEGIF